MKAVWYGLKLYKKADKWTFNLDCQTAISKVENERDVFEYCCELNHYSYWAHMSADLCPWLKALGKARNGP